MTNGSGDSAARLWKIMVLLVALAMATIGFNYSRDVETEKYVREVEILARDALHEAKTSRPNPYTSLDQTEYVKGHIEAHLKEVTASAQLYTVQLALLEERVVRKIETLPRPPEVVANMIQDINQRLQRIEVLLNARSPWGPSDGVTWSSIAVPQQPEE